MITAAEARKIADSNMKDEHDSFLFKYAIDQIEIYVMATSRRGGRSFFLQRRYTITGIW